VAFGGSVALAALAGFVDAVGFILSGGLFVSFMSGNSTQAGVEGTRGDVQVALLAVCLVGGFVFGVMLGRLLSLLLPSVRMGGRLLGLGAALLVGNCLVALWPEPGYSLAAVAAVMGAMNTLFVVDGRAKVAITYATGTLVSVGLGVADRLAGVRRGGWIRPLLLWAAITVGALVGALAWAVVGLWSLTVAAACLVLLGVVQMARRTSQRREILPRRKI
jgi:uncharacterized membrane protein YoaK (UPF0700 family)